MPDLTREQRHARNDRVLEELRTGNGRTADGTTLVVMTITGARTGRQTRYPVCVYEDGHDLVVAASAGGQAHHPQWYQNLVRNPDIAVEYLGETFVARASTVPNGPPRDRLFHALSAEIDGLYAYQDRCRDSRQIPIVRIQRIGSS